MIISVGIDPSLTGTGVVILRDGRVEISETLLNHANLPMIERVGKITLGIANLIHDACLGFKPTIDRAIAAIEGFSYGSKGKSVFDIGYLGWRIREDLYKFYSTLPYIDVPPTSVKKFATGSGNAAKELILQQVYKRWGVEFHDNNQADAFVLAQIGHAYVSEDAEKLTAFQKDVLKALKR